MKTLRRIRRHWLRHPLADGLICGVAFVAVSLLFINFVLPAWAASFPVGNVVVDLGEWAPWVGISVTCFIWWDARMAKKHAAEAAAKATEAAAKAAVGVAKLEVISVQMDGMLAERDKDKVKEGEAKEKLVGKATAATLAEGQRQGMVMAATANELPKVLGADPIPVADDKAPLPVVDNRTAGAAERSAAALERTASATEEKKN